MANFIGLIAFNIKCANKVGQINEKGVVEILDCLSWLIGLHLKLKGLVLILWDLNLNRNEFVFKIKAIVSGS